MPIFKDRTGEIHGTFKIIKELGKNKVICRCLNCKNTNEYYKQLVVDNKAKCKHCNIGRNILNRVGETYDQLQITKELGGNKVACQCLKCGTTDEYDKQSVVRSTAACKHCHMDGHILNRVGEIYGKLKIIKELGTNKVECQCLQCRTTGEYIKQSVVRLRVDCKQCKINGNILNRVGETHGKLRIVRELGKNKVMCWCIQCGLTDEYVKQNVVRLIARCKHCNIKG